MKCLFYDFIFYLLHVYFFVQIIFSCKYSHFAISYLEIKHNEHTCCFRLCFLFVFCVSFCVLTFYRVLDKDRSETVSPFRVSSLEDLADMMVHVQLYIYTYMEYVYNISNIYWLFVDQTVTLANSFLSQNYYWYLKVKKGNLKRCQIIYHYWGIHYHIDDIYLQSSIIIIIYI